MPQPLNDPIPITTRAGRSTNPTLFQHLGNIELFNDLLFNRERVYQSRERPSPVRTSSISGEVPVEDKGTKQDSVQSIGSREEGEAINDNSASSYPSITGMAVGKRRGRPPRTASARAETGRKLKISAIKKRSISALDRTQVVSKIQKPVPKANSGKRVNGRGASVADAFVISDDDDNVDGDFKRPRQQNRTESLSPRRQLLKVDTPNSEDGLIPTSTQGNHLQSGNFRIELEHTKELEKLRQQLLSAQRNAVQIKEDLEREATELQRHQSVAFHTTIADYTDKLEAERGRSSDLSWECDYLRRELDMARSCLKSEVTLIRERDGYERLCQKEQDTKSDLIRKLTETGEDSNRRITELTQEIQQLNTQGEQLREEALQLKDENAALRVTSTSSLSQATESRSTASPAPSPASSSEQEQRLVNLRRTYITVRKRYDSLRFVATNITTTTRSWDYGSYGEFGQYLRQLKNALDEFDHEEQARALSSQVAKTE